MTWHRIWAVILRYLYLYRHSYDRLSEVFFTPAMEILLWGLTSEFFASKVPAGSPVSSAQVAFMIIAGIIFWQIVWRTQYDIPMHMLEELWNKNLVNMFATPLKFSEWIAAFLLLNLLRMLAGLSFAAALAALLYRARILTFGWLLVPFAGLLLLAGWALGFFIASLILRYGTKVQALAWTLGTMIAPLSAIYYPVAFLPPAIQRISLLLPTTYLFEGARMVISTGTIDWRLFAASFGLSIVYITITAIFLRRSFARVLDRGLVKLY